eukprot:1187719-Prorocentrum_minimum.AAC.1
MMLGPVSPRRLPPNRRANAEFSALFGGLPECRRYGPCPSSQGATRTGGCWRTSTRAAGTRSTAGCRARAWCARRATTAPPRRRSAAPPAGRCGRRTTPPRTAPSSTATTAPPSAPCPKRPPRAALSSATGETYHLHDAQAASQAGRCLSRARDVRVILLHFTGPPVPITARVHSTTQDVQVYSHDGQIGRGTYGYILTMGKSDAGRTGIFSRWTNRTRDVR